MKNREHEKRKQDGRGKHRGQGEDDIANRVMTATMLLSPPEFLLDSFRRRQGYARLCDISTPVHIFHVIQLAWMLADRPHCLYPLGLVAVWI